MIILERFQFIHTVSSSILTINDQDDRIVNMFQDHVNPLLTHHHSAMSRISIRRNHKKSFVYDLMQVKLKPFQARFVPGDESLKYIDSQHSKQVAVQKRFYQKGLYKQNGRFSRALTHLLETNKISSDDDSTDTPITSNNSKIDMSNIDFNIPSKKLKVIKPP